MSPIFLFGAGLLILGIGVGIGMWIGNLNGRKASAKAGELEAALDNYRREVSEHFNESAAHFQAIGDEYRKLYEHMANGARSLCDAGTAGAAVRFDAPDLLPGDASVDAKGEPPRDYDPAGQEAESPGLGLAAVAEPSDEELEAAEELLAEPDLLAEEEAETEKTYH